MVKQNSGQLLPLRGRWVGLGRNSQVANRIGNITLFPSNKFTLLLCLLLRYTLYFLSIKRFLKLEMKLMKLGDREYYLH